MNGLALRWKILKLRLQNRCLRLYIWWKQVNAAWWYYRELRAKYRLADTEHELEQLRQRLKELAKP